MTEYQWYKFQQVLIHIYEGIVYIVFGLVALWIGVWAGTIFVKFFHHIV